MSLFPNINASPLPAVQTGILYVVLSISSHLMHALNLPWIWVLIVFDRISLSKNTVVIKIDRAIKEGSESDTRTMQKVWNPEKHWNELWTIQCPLSHSNVCCRIETKGMNKTVAESIAIDRSTVRDSALWVALILQGEEIERVDNSAGFVLHPHMNLHIHEFASYKKHKSNKYQRPC